LYRDGTTFVCQGPSLEAVSKRFTEIMGNKKVGVIETNEGKNALIIDGILKGGGEVK